MATKKPKKKAAAPTKAAGKAPAKKAAKTPAKKKAAKKTAAKAEAPAKKAAKKAPAKKDAKKTAAKKAPPKKAAPKKAATKKAATKKAAAKKKPAKKKAAAKTEAKPKRAKRTPPTAKAPRPEREARGAKPDLPNRETDLEDTADLDEISDVDVVEIEEDNGEENGDLTPRRKRATSLPEDHEILDPGPMRGEPVDKGTVIEAVRAAFKADEEHPVRGREFLGARSPVDVPKEGEVDYARAVESQRAAAEVLARADMVGEERKAVDERIAEVYARDAWESEEE
jgi:hypothetical protein